MLAAVVPHVGFYVLAPGMVLFAQGEQVQALARRRARTRRRAHTPARAHAGARTQAEEAYFVTSGRVALVKEFRVADEKLRRACGPVPVTALPLAARHSLGEAVLRRATQGDTRPI